MRAVPRGALIPAPVELLPPIRQNVTKQSIFYALTLRNPSRSAYACCVNIFLYRSKPGTKQRTPTAHMKECVTSPTPKNGDRTERKKENRIRLPRRTYTHCWWCFVCVCLIPGAIVMRIIVIGFIRRCQFYEYVALQRGSYFEASWPPGNINHRGPCY